MAMDFKGYCDRCNKKINSYKMSYFNTDNLCNECQKKEERHPLYEEAKRRELEEVRKGNYNFEGIGKPDDL